MTSEPRRRAIGSLRAVALDAPDIDLLATFYEQLAGWRRVPDNDDNWITLDSGDGWRIGLQRATDHVPPHWPDQDRPQQAHLDLRVPDIDAAAERAQQLAGSGLPAADPSRCDRSGRGRGGTGRGLDIGATRLDGAGPNWRVYADPAGKPFCLVWTGN